MRPPKLLISCAVLALLLSGCGGGDGLVDVSGTVSYKGKAVPKGMIWFDPAASHSNKPAQGFAFIEEGKFDSRQKGRGVAKGPYQIRVEAYDGKVANEFPYGKPLAVGNIETRMELAADGKFINLDLK